jgi:hypothetical protein
MADPIDTPSGVGAERTGGERARMILAELADAAQSAALSVVEAQRARAATKVADIATAMHAAAHSLEQSSNPAVAECARSAADQVAAAAATIRGRSWSGLLADLEQAARRQPATFVAAAVVIGFVAGRLVTALTRDGAVAPTAGGNRWTGSDGAASPPRDLT